MTPVQIITRKRDGGELSEEQIAVFIQGYARGEIPDYQMAALAMGILLRGMTTAETTALTEQMLRSGVVLEWPQDGPPKVDKHSTGGVGDKVSLILAPVMACCGLRVPMLSGRGLGATGGTLDKLEAIPGFRTDLSIDEIVRITQQVGCVITGASSELAPADRKLYALRDVTGTVPSIPLITASIMSKKLAEGLDSLVLDVKFGSGAFMKSAQQARQLARSLVRVGTRMGVKTTAFLTDMNQPLGRMAGNAVEVNESVAALENRGPQDVMQLVYALGSELLVQSGMVQTQEKGVAMQQRAIESGRAREKFCEMATAQGGDPAAPRMVAAAHDFTASQDGYLCAVDTELLGQVIIQLGGGRQVISDQIDRSVGLEMLVRLGDRVGRGEPLLRVFSGPSAFQQVQELLARAITIGEQPCAAPPLILERITIDQIA